MMKLYGIPNCDTVKKARAWLKEQQVSFVFHDFRQQGLPLDRLMVWEAKLGWQVLLNQRGTTWRKLAVEVQRQVVNAATACELMREQVSVIKRPVVEWEGGLVTVGFDPSAWASHLRL